MKSIQLNERQMQLLLDLEIDGAKKVRRSVVKRDRSLHLLIRLQLVAVEPLPGESDTQRWVRIVGL